MNQESGNFKSDLGRVAELPAGSIAVRGHTGYQNPQQPRFKGSDDSGRIRKYHPFGHLASHVDYYWLVTDTPRSGPVVNIYANGGVGLILNMGDPLRLDNRVFGRGLLFDQATSASVQIQFSGRINALGIRFNPGGFSRFFAMDVSQICAAPQKFATLSRRLTRQCIEIVDRCTTDREKIVAIEMWLACKNSEVSRDASLVRFLVESMARERCNVDLAGLAREAGGDMRRLQRLFKKHVGMSPIKLRRVMRANDAKRMMDADPEMPLAEVTYQCGYYDQAHFNREFKAMFGLTPTTYRSSLRDAPECWMALPDQIRAIF